MKNKDPHLLSSLPAYSEDGVVCAVVEAPKGSLVKLKYEIKLGAFTVAHSLPLGLTYPFDWGIVPSTQAAVGDPSAHRIGIEVTDIGIGIEPEILPKVFDAFEQGDSTSIRQYSGLGLGLMISRVIVKAHGGSINAESTGRNLRHHLDR